MRKQCSMRLFIMINSLYCHHTNYGSEQSDHADGHNEAGPAVPVFCGWDEGEQDLPEDSEKVHDIVETRW